MVTYWPFPCSAIATKFQIEWSFLESFNGQMLLKNKVQWLDLASHLWQPLVGLPLAKTTQVHYDFMVKYFKLWLSSSLKNYYWFFQYMGSDNGDVCNILPFLGVKYSKSFYFIISFYFHFVNHLFKHNFLHGYIFSYAPILFLISIFGKISLVKKHWCIIYSRYWNNSQFLLG